MRRISWRSLLVTTIATGLLVSGCSAAKPLARTAVTSGAASSSANPQQVGSDETKSPLPAEAERVKVPGFDGATAWLNVDHALSMKELAGHVVVVDFWTSCCINCLQTLPVLASIEDTFASDPVVVVGVHSPKFDAETERARLSDAVRQYSIKHPVAVDGSMKVWNAWGVDAWPTVVVLDTRGRAVWVGSGEPDRETLAAVVRSALAEGKSNGSLVAAKIAGITPEKDDSGALAFPGKVTVLTGGGLAVSDTGHNRIVLFDAAGKVTSVIGSGLSGNTDGGYADVSFRKPQGIAQLGNALYVADTENHEIRAVDLETKTVSTVVGTGALGHDFLQGTADGKKTALRSPWDVLTVGDKVYVTLAGSHQIGVFDPKTKTIGLFAGDGHERRRDGIGEGASFAQPSGLATDGKSLFVADSETSSIRSIDLASASVKTVVGKDLFVFGDVDGAAQDVRLQHPIGIGYGAGAIWVADTYNSKIKKIDPATGKTTTFAGGGDRKNLFEPSGVVVRGSQLVVTDTDHHRLVSFAIAGAAEKTLSLEGLEAPARGVAVAAAVERARAKPEERITAGSAYLAKAGNVHVDWQVPSGTGINQDAPFRAHFLEAVGATLPADVHGTGKDVQKGFDIGVTPAAGSTIAHVRADVDVVVCDIQTHRVCVPVRREISFDVHFGGVNAPALQIPLPIAK